MTRTFAENLLLTLALAACLALIGHAAFGQERHIYCHNPLAVDGDTIDCAGTRIRLMGVDAPEIAQQGGKSARVALSVTWFDVGAVRCRINYTDKYGRLVAICSSTNVLDLGQWLVRHGYAWDYPAYSGGKYSAEQEQARADRLGIWAGEPEAPPQPPWDYRARRK
jgi:endonuclease YncB( thermonuclease family)